MYPTTRLRRNRSSDWVRDLVAESHLKAADLVLPVFIVEGQNQKQEIEHMPGVHRLSIDQLINVAREAAHRGIKMISLFPALEQDMKSDNASEAYNLDNLMCRAIRAIKNGDINIGVCVDVALDPYTKHGHDGILSGDDVDNDKTISALCNQAMVLAKSGADVIAPSDMMDGRVGVIREYLDGEKFEYVNLMPYSAKYNSSFYGPFRSAVKSEREGYLSKATYQMDYRNIKEALREIELDISEGADMVMIKPGMPYLDVIKEAANSFEIPIFAYQVSGEYSMLRLAADAGAFDWTKALMESIYAFKRAGAYGIFTYGALEITEIIY